MHPLCYLLLAILTQVCKGTSIIHGIIGHNVTLPCRYDAHARGVLSFCWGRGKVPTSQCSSTILSSVHGTVDFRQSPRYQLLGRVAEGDVSLTITHAQRSDAGVYGCRVEVPGWFNDLKFNTKLVMEEAPVKQPVTQDRVQPTTASLEVLTSLFAEVENDEPVMDFVTAEERSKAFLGMGDIGRIAAIFFCTIIIILILIFCKRFVPGTRPETVENIYENVQVP